MKVLFAADASPGAERARDLLRTLALPTASTVRIVAALGTDTTTVMSPEVWGPDVIEAALASLQSDIAMFAQPLRREGLTVEIATLRGRAASAIVDEVDRWRPDLVVVGSHGRGAVASAILGSVAAEVIDHSSAPVLVARTPAVSSVLLAQDGSDDARRAEDLVATGIFRAPVRVVSAVHVTAPMSSGVAPTLHAAAAEAYRDAVKGSRAEHERLAREASERLRAAGVTASMDVREGNPREVILAAAEDSHADLIAMGTRGRTGISRLLLGSVARAILHRTPASVLVARGQRG